jgi:hypothetical protein
MLKNWFLTGAILLAMGTVSPLKAAEKWQERTYTTASGQTLRGYGSVSVKNRAFETKRGQQAWIWEFSCQNPEKAQTLVGKFLADLDLSPDVSQVQLTIDDQSVPGFKTASGAIFVGAVQGAVGRLVATPDTATLSTFAKQHPAVLKGAVAKASYPLYLDRFDRYGWGCYGMGGFSNYHEWMTKADGKRTFKDPTKDVDFMIKHKFRFEPWLDPTSMDTSDGIAKNTEAEWMIKMLEDAGMPFSFRVYGAAGGADWTARRFGEVMEQPADWMMSGFIRPWLQAKSSPHITWHDKDIHRYMAVKTMDLMKPYANHPLNLGWMHPHGELEHGFWYGRHADYSPMAQRQWRQYLQKRGVSLAEASIMFTGEASSYSDWEQVCIPEFATFAGLNGMVKDLNGPWFYRRGRISNDKKDANYPGLREEWYKHPLDVKNWTMLDNVPGGDRIYEILGKGAKSNYTTTWFRRAFTIPPTDLQPPNSNIYFYWFPMTHDSLHSGEYARYNKVYINGQKAGEIGTWGAIEISKLLKPGTNEITVQLFGPWWKGRAFLSTETPAVYPYLGKERNRLLLLWMDWDHETKYDAWGEILDGMRQVDPNRPIKFMAPMKMRADRWTKLARDWGGYGHFTGEGIWFFPWYKRYGFLYDVPGSSELAGPADSIPKMFNGFRRTFLAGLNAHIPVFLAQTYTRPTEMRQWWEAHNPVLKRMGKYDIDPQTAPQVLLYRSTHGTIRLVSPRPYPTLGESTREIQNGWNWDIGRGTLQTLGHSYLYLDDQGLSDGKMNGFKVMVDTGNETIPEDSLDAIAEWVKAGGTYITLPFSGRNTELEPDAWKISRLTGCKIGDLREGGKGTVTIGKEQGVFKSLAGKTFPDNGKSMDYIGNNLNLYSVELQPGENSEVLGVYENGKAAIVRRKFGEGQVIALGSAFWRDCQDSMGLWRPEPLETDFMADLFAGIGLAPPVCTTDDRLVWAQPYRSNNGLDAVTCLVSWHEDEDVEVKVSLRLPHKPAKLVAYGVDGENELDFAWKDGIATAKLQMPAKEVKVVNAVVYSPGDAVVHWWNYQQKMWHQLKEPTIDFSPYRQGKWADPTLDLRQGGAELSLADPATGKAEWKPCQVSILNFWGAEPNQPVWLRKTFTVPQEWQDQGGRIFLVSGAWSGRQYEGGARLTLNGTQLHDFSRTGYGNEEFDVTKLLNEGSNVVMLQFKGDQKYQGVKGQLYLYHWTPPARRVSLAGNWQGTDVEHKPITVSLPGNVQGWDLTRKVFIPEEWRGKVRVRLYMDGNAHATLGAFVNDRQVRRHHHCFNTVGDLDITNFLHFGEENTLNLLHRYGTGKRDPKRPLKWDIKTIELHLRPVESPRRR